MKFVVRTSNADVVYLPVSLMDALGLHDGDLVKAQVDQQALRLSRVSRFLELRGALAEDEEFDRALELLEEG
ncbi:MAG: hypothetical protein H5T61_14225 [Thermoflexales bacterium]|nr:hypothetical protein [Thermoflexales bacterium]